MRNACAAFVHNADIFSVASLLAPASPKQIMWTCAVKEGLMIPSHASKILSNSAWELKHARGSAVINKMGPMPAIATGITTLGTYDAPAFSAIL